METMKKQHVEFLLDRVKSRLDGSKQLAAVRLALTDIAEALKELNEPDPRQAVRVAIELHTDAELLAEIQKRLSSRSPAMA